MNIKKKVSIIIPVYNVEKYIARCLNSLVEQTLEEIEIIVINDGSTDNSQKVIEEFSKKYPNKIKSFNIENGGAAHARNVALEKATGEYIGFVDGDDYVAENMFESLYKKAVEDNADIVTCAYYREMESRCVEKEVAISANFGKNVFQEPNLLIDSTPYIWNKIFRSDLIKKEKLNFPDLKIYEDLVFTYKMFISANKISKVYEPLYFYTVTREASLTHKFTEKRFDIFNAFQDLTNFIKQKGCLDTFNQEILFILLKHIYVVLEKDSSFKTAKLKKKYINEVFDYLDNNYENWKDNIYFEKFKKNKKLYKSKAYWKLRIIFNRNIRRKTKRISNILKKAKKLLRKNSYLGHVYIKYLKNEIDEKAILLNSQQGDNINGNMFYILKELQDARYKDYNIYVAFKEQKENDFIEKLNNYNFRYKLIKINTKMYAKVLATSKYLFNDTSFPVYFIKRDEQIYLNTWHGTPLKTLGKATTNDFYDIANVQKNFVVSDYLLYPSEYMMKHMIDDYMLSNIAESKILLSGYPRNEIFFDTERRNKLKSELSLENKEIIAYMPTWRGNVRKVAFEEQLSIIREYLTEINHSLKENQILYVNFHPYVGNNIDFELYDKIRAFPVKYETYDFLNICDILITDYSSVFFDYALTRKKIILFTYDEEEYLRDRGMYININDLPFPKAKNVEQLVKEINSPKEYNDKEFLRTYCNYDAEDISKRICRYIIFNKKEKIITKNIEKNGKDNVLIYAGPLNKNKKTDQLILAAKNSNKEPKYNYYVSYITRNVKSNKRQLKELRDVGINYMGQLGDLSNMGRGQIVLISLIGKLKFLYNIFKNKVDSIYKTELKRIYDNINFKGVLLYGKIGVKKIYEFSNVEGKKIIFLTSEDDFNKKINPKIYERFDYILSEDEQVLNLVKKYCKNANTKKIEEVTDLNNFSKYMKK